MDKSPNGAPVTESATDSLCDVVCGRNLTLQCAIIPVLAEKVRTFAGNKNCPHLDAQTLSSCEKSHIDKIARMPVENPSSERGFAQFSSRCL